MPDDELPQIAHKAPAEGAQRKVSISNALSAAALLVSLIALVFTGLQWRESHNQLILSMKPSVDFDIEIDVDDLPVGIGLSNAGPGPAVIRSIAYYVDKKAVGDVDKLVDFASLEDILTYGFDEGDTLAVGERHWLVWRKDKAHGKAAEEELDKFIDFVSRHLAVEVEFCPVLPGECYKKCSTKGWCK